MLARGLCPERSSLEVTHRSLKHCCPGAWELELHTANTGPNLNATLVWLAVLCWHLGEEPSHQRIHLAMTECAGQHAAQQPQNPPKSAPHECAP